MATELLPPQKKGEKDNKTFKRKQVMIVPGSTTDG